MIPTLTTARLTLRPWQDADRDPVAAITADPVVMRFFARPRDRAQSDAWVGRVRAHWDRHGFGIFAACAHDLPGTPLIGFVGLATAPDTLACAPAVEAVWTLGQAYWRRGYAAEAAAAVIQDGFTRLDLPEIVAFTAVINTPSRGVMEKLGMTRDPAEDFDHPAVPEGYAVRRHVLYRLARPT